MARRRLGAIISLPERERVLSSNLRRLADRIASVASVEVGGPFNRYDVEEYRRLHQWSVANTGRFWKEVFEDLELRGSLGSTWSSPQCWPSIGSPGGTDWYPNAEVNHAELLLEGKFKADDSPALVVASEASDERRTVNYGDLRARTAALAESLRADGIGPGTRVAGIVNNDDETVVAMLAATSLGASWSSISTDFGETAILDRLTQVSPVALFAHANATYRGRKHDVIGKLASLSLPSIRRCVVLGEAAGCKRLPSSWRATPVAEYAANDAPRRPTYVRGGFDREVYVMFSSGTTGKPKCLAQGIGATMMHAKEGAYHFDLRPSDNSLWVTTTAWMMWNWLIGAALATGGAATLYDGDPLYGGASRLFRVVAFDCALFGTSAGHLAACSSQVPELSMMRQLRVVGSTGSPCAASTFDWARRAFPKKVPLVSTSGGTDLNGSFATGCPWLPVRSETLQCAGLGLDVQIRDDQAGDSINRTGDPGELACAQPFPSAPLYMIGDDSAASRYRAAYFPPNFARGLIWRHGDWAHRDEEGGFVIHGRSDATLNPGGVRIGTADIYNAIEKQDDVLVAGQAYKTPQGATDVRVVLFIVAPNSAAVADLHEAVQSHDIETLIRLARPPQPFIADIIRRIRSQASPRHVPAAVCWCPKIPLTTNGKKLEVAVNRALAADHNDTAAVERIKSSVVGDPQCLDFFFAIARHIPTLLH